MELLKSKSPVSLVPMANAGVRGFIGWLPGFDNQALLVMNVFTFCGHRFVDRERTDAYFANLKIQKKE